MFGQAFDMEVTLQILHIDTPSPYAEVCHAHAVEMHNVFDISEALQ